MSIVTDIVGGLAKPVTDLISEFITDKDAAAKLAHEISILAVTQTHTQVMMQMDVNREESKHASIFVAGWRPAMGWTCVSAYFLAYVGLPMLSFITDALGTQVNIPAIDFGALAPVLLGMLGLGAMRSFDKVKGTA